MPEGQHLGWSAGPDGDYGGLLFDEDNHLVGQAELSEVHPEDLMSGGSLGDPASPPCSEELDIEEIVRGLEALVELTILLSVAGGGGRTERSALVERARPACASLCAGEG